MEGQNDLPALSPRLQQRMGEPRLRDAREKEEFEAGGGGGDSIDLGIELEGPGERAETSRSSARDLPPGCLGSRWTLLEVSWIRISLSKTLLA